jgi:geranylgeranyl diphosphate synthase, type I
VLRLSGLRAGAQTRRRPARASLAGMATDPAALARIRAEVALALERFMLGQREVLAAVGDDMLAWVDVVSDLLAGGKRLRPAFCYWGWRAAGGADCPEIYAAAAALELLHASALVHDDVIDASDTRRGRPAVHRQFAARQGGTSRTDAAGAADGFGTGAAILIGDALLSWTDELYRGSGLDTEALQRGQPVLNAMRTEVAAGQYLDLLNQFTRSESVHSAMRVVTYKTAKYTIERPLHLGAALAGATGRLPGTPGGLPRSQPGGDSVARACTEYGLPLGVAFQLRDDILGIFGDPARTGKPVTGDISEGKRTVLMALARERATAAQLTVLDAHLGDRELTEAGAAQVRAVIIDTGALAECEALISATVKEATAALDGAPITEPARQALTELAILATERDE